MKTITIALLVALNGLSNAQNSDPNRAVANPQTTTGQQKTKTMENQAKRVVSEFLTAVQTGDQAKLAASLHPNVEWNQPGSNRFSGTKKSSTAVFQMVGGMFELTANTLALTDVKVLTVNGNQVACLIHWEAAQPTGVVLDVDNIDVYTVENGKIVSATIYSADIAQEDHFWAK